MEMNSTVLTKRLAETKPGELVVFRTGNHRGHCIVLGQEAQHTMLGALDMKSEKTPHPFHFRSSNTSRCVSYGSEWFAKPSRSAEFWAGNHQYRLTPGSLHLEESRWIVCFDSIGYDYTELHFDLTNGGICDGPSDVAAPVLHWFVWESRAEFEREADPLVTVTAAQR